ncbi:unnamed protein product [Cylicostephanus goldi]|uniref:SET domain-containing protein n=1 Tax=Cylicostephanus goldi TaxID=71465 RepID=A0A3P6SM50_CYLGO|nr:unnamed protein product [Cylicostephanus goldi]
MIAPASEWTINLYVCKILALASAVQRGSIEIIEKGHKIGKYDFIEIICEIKCYLLNVFPFQIESDIFFYSIRSIKPNSELTFWFSKDYSQKLNYPVSCEAARMAKPKRSAPPPQQPWAIEDRASPQEALDYSMKREAIESSRSEKADRGDTSDVEPGDDAESEKSNSNRNDFSCSPPSLAEVQTRPNVIQNPVHRPVPTRLASLPAPSPVRPSPLNPLSLFQDYFRRTQQLSESLRNDI